MWEDIIDVHKSILIYPCTWWFFTYWIIKQIISSKNGYMIIIIHKKLNIIYHQQHFPFHQTFTGPGSHLHGGAQLAQLRHAHWGAQARTRRAGGLVLWTKGNRGKPRGNQGKPMDSGGKSLEIGVQRFLWRFLVIFWNVVLVVFELYEFKLMEYGWTKSNWDCTSNIANNGGQSNVL